MSYFIILICYATFLFVVAAIASSSYGGRVGCVVRFTLLPGIF